MIEILEFIFQDFWHWLGGLIMLCALVPWSSISILTINREKKKNGKCE